MSTHNTYVYVNEPSMSSDWHFTVIVAVQHRVGGVGSAEFGGVVSCS